MTDLVTVEEIQILAQQPDDSVLVDEVEVVKIVAVAEQGPRGIQGIQGPSGGAGGATYTHTQSIPAAVWTVAHNLSRRPSVSVTDHLGNLLVADVLYVDADIVQVTHGTPYIGFAYCN